MLSAEDFILTFLGFDKVDKRLETVILGIFLTGIPMVASIFWQDPKAFMYYYGTRFFLAVFYLSLIHLYGQSPEVGWSRAFVALLGGFGKEQPFLRRIV
jgi:hypothetical protein